jgi:hypothetical protein
VFPSRETKTTYVEDWLAPGHFKFSPDHRHEGDELTFFAEQEPLRGLVGLCRLVRRLHLNHGDVLKGVLAGDIDLKALAIMTQTIHI